MSQALATAQRPATVHAAYQRYVATFATLQPAEIVENHAPDGRFWLHAGQPAITGRAAIAAAFGAFFTQWPNFGFEVYRTLFTDTGWVLDWAVTATLTNPDGSSRPVRFDALDVVEIDADGLVTRKDTFVDSHQVRAALEG